MSEWLALILVVSSVLFPIVVLFGFSGCQLVFQAEPAEFHPAFEITLDNERIRRNRTLIVRIEPPFQRSGEAVRIVLQRAAGGDLNIRELYISEAADSGNPYDAPTTPDGSKDPRLVVAEQLVSQDPLMTLLELEPVPFPFDQNKPLLIAFNLGNSGSIREVSTEVSQLGTSYISPPDVFEATLPQRSPGYDIEPHIYAVQRIDVA